MYECITDVCSRSRNLLIEDLKYIEERLPVGIFEETSPCMHRLKIEVKIYVPVGHDLFVLDLYYGNSTLYGTCTKCTRTCMHMKCLLRSPEHGVHRHTTHTCTRRSDNVTSSIHTLSNSHHQRHAKEREEVLLVDPLEAKSSDQSKPRPAEVADSRKIRFSSSTNAFPPVV